MKEKLAETNKYLRKMQAEVVKPLIHEIWIKDKLTERQEEQIKIAKNNAKKLYTLLRVPRMCDEFHKTINKIKLSEDEETRAQKNEEKLKKFILEKIADH